MAEKVKIELLRDYNQHPEHDAY